MTGSKYVLKGLSLYSGLDEETLELCEPDLGGDTEALQILQMDLDHDATLQERCDVVWHKFAEARWAMSMLLAVFAQTNTTIASGAKYPNIPGNTYNDKLKFLLGVVSMKTLAVFFAGMVLDVAKPASVNGGLRVQPYIAQRVSGDPSIAAKNRFVRHIVSEKIVPWVAAVRAHAKDYSRRQMAARQQAFRVRQSQCPFVGVLITW